MHLILKDSGKKSLVGFTGGDICLTVEGPSAVGRLAMPIVSSSVAVPSGARNPYSRRAIEEG
jgi:hypothetical protein